MRALEQGQAAGAGPSVMCGVDTSDEKEKKKKQNRVCGPSILPAPSQLPPTPSQDQTEPLLSETIPTAYSVTSGFLRDKDHVPKEAFHPSSNPDAWKHPRFSLEMCWLWGRLTWGPSTATPSSPAALFLKCQPGPPSVTSKCKFMWKRPASAVLRNRRQPKPSVTTHPA